MMDRKAFETIIKIVERAEAMKITWGDRMTCVLDIENAHKLFNLRLDEFLSADVFDFCHDFCGIQNNFNRRTMQMDNCFVPRFSTPD